MNSINFILRYVIIMLLFSCKSNSKHDSNVKYYESDMGYEDGTYCDEIDYYYSETGTSSTYTLNVEIENNELKVIHWPNNGWLDESHFSSPDISGGEANFTSDKGVDYTVKKKKKGETARR